MPLGALDFVPSPHYAFCSDVFCTGFRTGKSFGLGCLLLLGSAMAPEKIQCRQNKARGLDLAPREKLARNQRNKKPI